jgi:hypothetical protein
MHFFMQAAFGRLLPEGQIITSEGNDFFLTSEAMDDFTSEKGNDFFLPPRQ